MTKLYLIDESAGILDEVQAWLLAKADNEGWVDTILLRQLVNRMYHDCDYLARRSADGRRTAYDYAVDRDQKALAWAIRALVQHVSVDEKARPDPPKPPRKPSRQLSAEERAGTKGRPSWNGKPKRDGTVPFPPAHPPT